jgi:hypothetical protein
MASVTGTPYRIHISPENTGLLKVKQTEEASNKVSELLQKDLEVSTSIIHEIHTLSVTK